MSRKALRFIQDPTDFPELALGGPEDRPRLIDVRYFDEEYSTKDLRLIDATVSLLYNYDQKL